MRNLRRLVPYLKRYRRDLFRGLVFLLLTTAFSVASPWVLRFAIDDLTARLTFGKIQFFAGAIMALVVVEGFFRYNMRMILVGVSREIEFELRNDVFRHLLELPANYYQTHRIGDIMSRATNDMSAVRMVLGPGIMYTANTVATFVATVSLMLTISPTLLGLALVPLGFVSLAVRHYGRHIHDLFEQVQAQLGEMNTIVQENLSGIRVVKAYVQEPHEIRHFDLANKEYVRRNEKLIRVTGILYPGIQFLMGTGAVLVLWLGGRLVVGHRISLGQFVAFGAYLSMLNWPMIAVGWVTNLFERGDASMGRILAILEAKVEIDDREAEPVETIEGEVEFRDLTFSYDSVPVLKGVSLKAKAGTTVAIVGPTGSGKSTLVSLIPRLFEAPPGSLFVDGREVRQISLASLRGAIGFVPQESFLFSDTLRDNVAFGVARDTDSRVERAAEVAQLSKDVLDFPLGFGTFVGERGITLSGGQKQRTALARALAVDPRILVLDDSLASVDTDTEEAILRGLRDVRSGRTTFLVSHRASTVKDADLIVVLREGEIVERGTHDELLNLGGFYAELYRRQLLEEEMERA
jgi:ATP-binding cassette subfamily B multidrug efflux pump